MTINEINKSKKIQYVLNREAAKYLVLSSGNFAKYEYLTVKILPSQQNRILEQAKFNFSPIGEAFEKQTNTIEQRGKK